MNTKNISSWIARGASLVALVGALASAALGQPGVVLLQDDFNRGDSTTLGGPWTELNENTAQIVQGDQVAMPAVIDLDSGTFAFRYSAEAIDDIFGCFRNPPGLCRNFGRPAALAPLSQPATLFPVTISFDFTPHADERVQHRVGLMSATDGLSFPGNGIFPALPSKGLEVFLQHTSTPFDNSMVSIVLHDGTGGGGTVLASKAWSFQFEGGTTYSVQVTIAADFSVTVDISDAVNSDTVTSPSAAAGFPLDQLYVIDAQGGVSFDTPGTGEFLLRVDSVVVAQTPLGVEVDVKPGSFPNSINLSSAGVVPVAILSSANFDATTVDADTVSLAGAAVKMVGKSGKLLAHEEDVNNDGLLDLVCQILTEQLLIVPGDSIAVLEGVTEDGLPIRGEDSVRIVGD